MRHTDYWHALTNGNFYPGGFNATTTGTKVSVPLIFGKAQVLAIKWKKEGVAFWGIGVHNFYFQKSIAGAEIRSQIGER
jgi:hypothetical protein